MELLVQSQAYVTAAWALRHKVETAVAALPNPAGLTAPALQAATGLDGIVQKLIDTTRLFTYLLPGLVINVACFRAQLESQAALTIDISTQPA